MPTAGMGVRTAARSPSSAPPTRPPRRWPRPTRSTTANAAGGWSNSCRSDARVATPLRWRYARRMGNAAQDESASRADLRLFHTGEPPCGYCPDRLPRDLARAPRDARMPSLYPLALGWGFRRPGDIVYRGHCRGCRACVAVRLPVARFVPDRSQRRCLAHNADVAVRILPAERTGEQLALYQRYLKARHRGGGMDDHGAAEFDQFLVGAWSHGRFLELRERESHRLLAVAVT